ncbi:MAG: peptidoglycan-binding protein, partial [Nannocystaceae bacterium]
PEWEKLPMAKGDPTPAWPLPTVTPNFATWSVGGGRPYGCELEKCERWHAGIDLTGAPEGALIVAPEDAEVVAVDRGWSDEAKAMFLRTKSGLFLVLGGFKKKSAEEFSVTAGASVKKGQKLGRVLGSYGMIHLETYDAKSRTANSVWWKSEPPPEGLLNPTNYVERMVGDRVSLVQTRQRHEALKSLGFYQGDVDDPWGTASMEALRAAQAALGLAADGVWGPKTEDAIHKALAAQKGCTRDECDVITEGDAGEGSRWLPWIVVGGMALGGVAVGVALARRRRASPLPSPALSEETDR